MKRREPRRWGRVLAVLALALLLSPAARAAPLIPAPQSVKTTGAALPLGQTVAFTASSGGAAMSRIGAFMDKALTAGGYSVTTGAAAVTVHLQRLADPPPAAGLPAEAKAFAAMGSEGYVMVVAKASSGGGLRVVVAATVEHGLFNGGMTLLQLMLDSAGKKAQSLAAQVILDYPDHPVRGGYLYSVKLPSSGGIYTLSPAVKARIDELARLKVNTLFLPQTLGVTGSSWAQNKAAAMAFSLYCRERFIEPVLSAGSLRNTYRADYRDGWWIRREPFHFASRTDAGQLLTNHSFEEHSCGRPHGWSLATISKGGAWEIDAAVARDGKAAMRLTAADDPQTGGSNSTNSLVLSQSMPSPGAGSYGLSVWFRTQGITGRQVQVTFYGRDAQGKTATSVISAMSGYGTAGWMQKIIGPLTVGAAVTTLRVYSRIQEPGHGAAWIDDVQVLPMKQDTAGKWQLVPASPTTREEAVADLLAKDLLQNGSLELDQNSDGKPDGWSVSAASVQGSWARDSLVATCGGHSMRLKLSNTPAGAASSNSLVLSQTTGPVPAGVYLARAWIRTDAVAGADPQLTLYSRVGSAVRELASDKVSRGTTGWKLYGTMIRLHKPADKLTLYTRLVEPGHGTMWVDDLAVVRVDGLLRNVLRKDYDLRLESTDLKTVYKLGVDYKVLDGELTPRFSDRASPTRVVRLPGGGISAGAKVLISYDANLYWSASNSANQSYNICTLRTLDDLFKPAIKRLISELGATSVNLNSDEIRGFNRSGACHKPDGSLKASNAAVLADFFNKAAAYARGLNPKVRVYAWDDMFSPVHNGGSSTYQVRYGGSPGATGEAVTKGLLGKGLSMMIWWYSNDWLYQMDAALRILGKAGHELLVAPHQDLTNIKDWSAMSVASGASRGVLVTPWSSEAGVPLASDHFWNARWEQVLFSSFEAADTKALAAQGYALSGGATWKGDGTCAMPRVYPTGANPGGVCISSSGGSVTLPAVAVENAASYQLIIHARSDSVVKADITWAQFDLSGVLSSTGHFTAKLGGTKGSFVRATVPLAPKVPPYLSKIQIDIATAAGAPELALDNVMLQVSRPACPNGLRTPRAPKVVDVSNFPWGKPLAVSFKLCNDGCRDLRLDKVTSPKGNLSHLGPPLPLLLLPGKCASLTANGPAPTSIQVDAELVLHTNGGQVTVKVTGLTMPGMDAGVDMDRGAPDQAAAADRGERDRTVLADLPVTLDGAATPELPDRGCSCRAVGGGGGGRLLLLLGALLMLLRRRRP